MIGPLTRGPLKGASFETRKQYREALARVKTQGQYPTEYQARKQREMSRGYANPAAATSKRKQRKSYLEATTDDEIVATLSRKEAAKALREKKEMERIAFKGRKTKAHREVREDYVRRNLSVQKVQHPKLFGKGGLV